MQLHFKRQPFAGVVEVVNPNNSPSEALEFALVHIHAGEHVERADAGRESVLVILSGTCSVEIEGMGKWSNLGQRANVFTGPATAIYVSPGVRYTLSTAAGAEIAVCRAPASSGGEPFVVRPEEVQSRTVGRDNWRREVQTIIGESHSATRLIVGETFNESGAWSSYPPHKHDVHDPPHEVRLQEIYYYRLQPSDGFGLQRIYSPERRFDQTFAVEDGDTVLIPFGYHPVVAAGGYRLYYLWMLAGEERQLRPNEDPRYAWVGGSTLA